MKIRVKTYIFTMVLICIITIFLYGLIYYILPRSYCNSEIEKVNKTFNSFVNENSGVTFSELKSNIPKLYTSIPSNIDVSIEGTDNNKDYKPKTNSIPNEPSNIKVEVSESKNTIKDLNIEGQQNFKKPKDTENVKTNVTKYNINLKEGEYTIRVVHYLYVEDLIRNEINKIFPFVFTIVIIFGVVFAFIYSIFITTPILKIKNQINQMKEGKSDRLIEINGSDELSELSYSVNSLYTSLKNNIEDLNKEREYKKHLLLSLSHELKTPIASISGILEGMLDEVYPYTDRDKYIRECRKISGQATITIKELLEIAKIDSIPVNKEKFYIFEVINEVIIGFNHLANEKNLSFNMNIDKSLRITTDKRLFKKAISNIIENSIKYSTILGMIEIKGDSSGINFKNPSTKLSEREMKNAFNPLFRGEEAKYNKIEGEGIGLFIVSKCLNLLDMRYELTNTENTVEFKIKFRNGDYEHKDFSFRG